MALNFDNFETVLQTKLDTITDEKDMLLLGKAIEATVGNVTVSEVQAEGTTQKDAVTAEGGTQISAVQAQGTSERNQINAMSSGFATTSSLSPVATSGSATDLSNLRTVGGQSIAGPGGDIATLPAGGSVGQVLKKDGSNNPSWGTDEGGKILQVKAYSIGAFSQSVVDNSNNRQLSWMNSYEWKITPTQSNSKILIMGDYYVGGATSHYYFDVWAHSTGFVNHWMQPADDGIGEDAYSGVHRGGGVGDQIIIPFHYLETHGVTAGTEISYRPHHAHWGALTISINKYDNGGNVNAMTKSGVILMEVSV